MGVNKKIIAAILVGLIGTTAIFLFAFYQSAHNPTPTASMIMEDSVGMLFEASVNYVDDGNEIPAEPDELWKRLTQKHPNRPPYLSSECRLQYLANGELKDVNNLKYQVSVVQGKSITIQVKRCGIEFTIGAPLETTTGEGKGH